MPPQRPKRLPTDFFDRLLSNQTDDQINDLLSSLVDEQIAPTINIEKEEDYFSSNSMIFEPAAAPMLNEPVVHHDNIEDTIITRDEELESLEDDRHQPIDDIIPQTPQMRAGGGITDRMEVDIPQPRAVELPDDFANQIFPDVPNMPEVGTESSYFPPVTKEHLEEAADKIKFPGLENLEVPPELLGVQQYASHENDLPSISEESYVPMEESYHGAHGLPDSILDSIEEQTQPSHQEDVEDIFGVPHSEVPESAIDVASYKPTMSDEDSFSLEMPLAEESYHPVVEEIHDHVYTHQELITAKLHRRWEHPKRMPKLPKLAKRVPPDTVDQSRISALDDYLQTKNKEKLSLHLSSIQRAAIWFVLPAFVAFSLFSWYPMIKGLFLSFFNFQPTGESVFIGVQNYARAFKDTMFLESLMHGGLFCGFALLLGFLPPIFLSIFINEFKRGKSLLKFLFFVPFLMPTVPAAILWKWIMDQGFGLLNSVIALLPVADPHIGWLTDPKLAMLSIVLLYIWKNTGWAMLIYSAALLNVDSTLYEEAEMHGATISQKVRYITLPTIRGTIAVMFLITIINTIQLFTEVYIMTNGGPMNSTEVIATYIYKQAFFYMDIGYASALSIIMLVMLLLITVFRLRRLGAGGS